MVLVSEPALVHHASTAILATSRSALDSRGVAREYAALQRGTSRIGLADHAVVKRRSTVLQANIETAPDAPLQENDEEISDKWVMTPSDETKKFATSLAKVADQIKCEEIRLLYVGKQVDWTDYFLIISAFSKPQMDAAMMKLEEEASKNWEMTPRFSNSGRSEWEVMDFSDLIVHIMSPRKREYYGIEQLYMDAEEVPLDLAPPESPQWNASLRD